jgi:DNA-binding IclR family transcriptional regulator
VQSYNFLHCRKNETIPLADAAALCYDGGRKRGTDMKENADEKKYIQSVERALGMLSYVADRGSARLGEISEAAGLKTSTTFGLLQTLEHCGYLARGRGDMEYSLGLASLKLGLCYSRSSGMAEKIHALLAALVKEVDETAYFEIRIGARYYYYDVVLSTQPLKVVPDENHFIDLPENSAVTKAYVHHSEQNFRYATDLEGVEAGLNCFAAPFYSGGTLLGCVALSGPSCRFSAARMEHAWNVYQKTLRELGLF